MEKFCCCSEPSVYRYIRGPQGVQGIQGEPGADGESALAAYGGLYNTAVQTLTFAAINDYVPLELNMIMPIKNMTVSGNTLRLNEAGDYEIKYNALINASVAADMAVTVRANGAVIPSTRGSQTLSYNPATGLTHDALFSGSAIVTLAAGDVIDMGVAVLNTLPAGLSAVVNSFANATLTVKKIGE